MKKRILALFLCLTTLLNIALFSVSAEDDVTPVYMGVNDHIISLQADKSTNNVPSIFGTSAADGMVWTDKSVTVNSSNFEVTLSALSQEYISTTQSDESSSTPADAVMILDMSGSMQSNTLTLDNDQGATRTKAMAKAVNEAIDIIMSANSKNRVTVYTFHRSSGNSPSSVYTQLLSLGHYTNSSWTSDSAWSNISTASANGKYVNYSVSGSNGKISTASGLKKDGKTYSEVSETTTGGTCTQQGIAAGISSLASSIKAETHTVDRKPFVLLFTDGAPGAASKNWYSTTPTDKNRTSHHNSGNSEVTALTILSAAFLKDTLDTAYDLYNTEDTDVEWFNIGLAVGENEQGIAFMDPQTVYDGTNASASSIKSYISSYTSGNYSSYSAYANNYVYAKEHVVFADSDEELSGAFNDFAALVEQSSMDIKRPILSGEGVYSGLTFTDVIGEGMKVSGITLKSNASTSIVGTATESASQTVYSFSGFDTTAALSKDSQGRQVLVWSIPTDEVAIYTFKDRRNFESGEYLSADPIRLSYKVELSDRSSFSGEPLYTNAFDLSKEALTTAAFQISNDNTYYYDVTTSASGLFESSTVKSAAFATASKASNITNSAAYATKYSTADITDGLSVTAKLGNNGVAKGVATIQKSVSKPKVRAGETVTYTIRLTNLSETELKDLTVTDLLPQKVSYFEGSVNGATASVSGQTLTFNVASIAAGSSADITYRATFAADAADGEYINDAYVQKISGSAVLDPGHVDATVVVENRYKVIYSWTGDIPTSAVIPTDSNTYTSGSVYPVDSTFTSASRIEAKDDFGNITDIWTFSGWSDPNSSIMGNRDVTIIGVWEHQSFTIDKHSVIYDWGTKFPDGKVLPVDNNKYVYNQPYSVDKTNKADDTVATYDKYNNQNGLWVFSGWTDPNNELMGNSDVTVVGSWEFIPVTVADHKVIYKWSGDIPPNHTPPTDSNSYVNGQPYSVDATYSSSTVIYEKDIYGNTTGTYTFSGWDDPNNAVMGNADVTIVGVWEYKAVEVPTHKVIYEWSGDIPPSHTPPTDSNAYVNGQPYSVDDTYTADTEIKLFDEHQNQTGVYTFSGWTDPNNAVMGNADVTIVGVWEFTPITVPDDDPNDNPSSDPSEPSDDTSSSSSSNPTENNSSNISSEPTDDGSNDTSSKPTEDTPSMPSEDNSSNTSSEPTDDGSNDTSSKPTENTSSMPSEDEPSSNPSEPSDSSSNSVSSEKPNEPTNEYPSAPNTSEKTSLMLLLAIITLSMAALFITICHKQKSTK
ncbi:MAG: DUF11 domain-containing protein [Oscillospiraceae bacterium]|nr:DUF11 domain-containing protein [Oscillospiraceae bacterium]